MSDFSAIINNHDLFQVEVEFRPIVDVLNYINEQLKSLEGRIGSLESVSKTHVTVEEHESANKAIIDRIVPLEERIDKLDNSITGLSTDFKSLESRTNLTINERVNEVLVSTNMNINHSASTINAQVRENYDEIKNTKQEVEDFIAAQKELNIESVIENVKKNTNGIIYLKKKLVEVEQNNTNSPRKYLELNNDAKNAKIVEQNASILNLINDQKDNIRTLTNDVNEIKERLSITEENILARNEDLISVKSSVSSTPQFNKSQNFDEESLKEELSNHEANVVNAMKAIQIELQQIRDNGQGLLDLPPMNLYNTVPSFFNEDKKILSISDSESAPVLELAEKPEEEKEEKPEEKQQVKKRSNRDDNVIKRFKRNNKSNKNENIDDSQNEVSKLDDSVQTIPAPKQIIETPKVDIDSIIRKIKNEIDLENIQKSFQKFKKDHDEIINLVERKVDREYVERLFDKFRIIVHNMNDRVKELASLSGDYATKDDFKLIVQVVKNMPKDFKPGTAVKRGPTCLFCGRPKSSIAGEITPRTASLAGSPPVQNIGAKDNEIGCEFVYGDGQAFRRDENFNSFPHLDILPPLPTNENEENKSANRAALSSTAAEANGRVSFTRNGERLKTSSSMPNSRISKSRK